MLRYLVTGALACMLAFPSLAQTVPAPLDAVMGTGGTQGNYYWAGGEILKRTGDLFHSSKLAVTKGSLENLRGGTVPPSATSGRFDLFFTQSDVGNQFVLENPGAGDAIELLRIVYTEYVHILCPTKSGWKTLSDIANAKGTRKMIVGPDGSGTAETWRIMRQADGKKYDGIERNPEPADYSSAHTVADSNDTCMLWVSGLNSAGMVSANALSVKTPDGKPSLQLVSIDDPKMLAIKGFDGLPLYKKVSISPISAGNGKVALYDHIIAGGGGWFAGTSVDLLAVPAYLMVRKDFKAALGRERLARLLDAIDDAQPTIWAKVNPAGSN